MNLRFITQTHSWGFGEIVALLLLSLPFMAAGATLSGKIFNTNSELETYKVQSTGNDKPSNSWTV